jgi:ATP-binding cassette subfamily A (ABC1) protein 3
MVGFPQVLILDEPSTGVDPAARAHINSMFTSGRRLATHEGFDLPATLLSTHVMDEAQALATRVGIMVSGELVTTGTIPRLQAKHCEFNFVEATFKTGASADAADELVKHLTAAGLDPTVLDTQVRGVKLQLPIDHASPNTLNLANVFELIEQVKERIGVQYYSVSPMGLEQIFLLMTKAAEEGEEKDTAEVELQ